MKIVILSNLFPPYSHGGAEEAAYDQAQKLLHEGNDVFVITLAISGDPTPSKSSTLGGESKRYNNGGQVKTSKAYHLKPRNIFNYFDMGKKPAWMRFVWHIIDTFNFWLANDIKKILIQEKPDLVIGHNLKGLSYLTPLKIKNLKIKNYLVVHDVSFYTPSGLIEHGKENIWEHKGFMTRAYRFFTRKLFSYPEKIFFPSVWLLNFYRKNRFFIKQEKIYKPNNIDFGTQPFQVKKEGFLYVGQLEKHKGVLLLLDAFEKLNVQSRILHIVGDGSLMSEIKKRAKNNSNIKIHGKVSREKLPEFYKRARAVIVPSIVYENAPNVVQEALVCNTPVIVSRIGGAYESIREGENGHTFEPSNAEDLIEKMKKYLN